MSNHTPLTIRAMNGICARDGFQEPESTLRCFCRPNALRALLKTQQDRGPAFLCLANALSALYPRQSDEVRLMDTILLAVST